MGRHFGDQAAFVGSEGRAPGRGSGAEGGEAETVARRRQRSLELRRPETITNSAIGSMRPGKSRTLPLQGVSTDPVGVPAAKSQVRDQRFHVRTAGLGQIEHFPHQRLPQCRLPPDATSGFSWSRNA